jgi:hypothetical protein
MGCERTLPFVNVGVVDHRKSSAVACGAARNTDGQDCWPRLLAKTTGNVGKHDAPVTARLIAGANYLARDRRRRVRASAMHHDKTGERPELPAELPVL